MKLVACLGYNLKEDNSIHPILENRLRDSVDVCVKNNESVLILMGGVDYRDQGQQKVSQVSVMKKFLDENFKEELENTKIIVEENTTSTIEQLCYLRELIDSGEFKLKYSDLVVVASEFFIERVKLYSEYIFNTNENITFIGSDIPESIFEQFKNTEENKLREAQIWLKDYKRGDYEEILNRQKNFQEQVQKGKTNYPVS
jgi:hypothetical protein